MVLFPPLESEKSKDGGDAFTVNVKVVVWDREPASQFGSRPIVLVQREMERSRLLLGTSDNAVRGAHRSCRKKSNKEGDIFLSDF